MRKTLFVIRRAGATVVFKLLAACVVCILGTGVYASNLDTIGVTLLRVATTNLNGGGVRVAQAEASIAMSPPTWEVNPTTEGYLPSDFTYYSSDGIAATYTNSLGLESSHADAVASFLYGKTTGVATNLAHIDNYEAGYFAFMVVPSQVVINDRIVNQSFVADTSEESVIDPAYDNYAATHNTLIVSSAGNGGVVLPPSTCYNGISVAAYGGASSVGPTPDNGRAKPDLTAPADATSFSSPLVSGGAAVLLQAGLRGDGGSDTNSATDIRTLKALLLNGAIKPADWVQPAPSPLDVHYGAGVLNVFNSYSQLAGGKHANVDSSTVGHGNAHPPTGAVGNLSSLHGWDFNTLINSTNTDVVNHYYFSVTNGGGKGPFTVTATLVWNRQASQMNINDLDLFLYDAGSGQLMAASASSVDNVEHIYVPGLAPGRYDLQVLKNGGAFTSPSENYALAF